MGKTEAQRIRLSGPIKLQYSKDHNIDFEKLLTASEFKEAHRIKMIEWSEAKRAEDAGYFIRSAIEMYEGIPSNILIRIFFASCSGVNSENNQFITSFCFSSFIFHYPINSILYRRT